MSISSIHSTPLSIHFDAEHFWMGDICGPHLIGVPGDARFSSLLRISIPFSMGSSFSWEEGASAAVKTSKPILWDLSFPEIAPIVTSQNLGVEKAKLLAVQHFVETIYPRFKGQSAGLILHKGPLDFGVPYPEIKRVRDLFLDRLASFCRAVPDELPIFLCFDVSNLSPSKAIGLLHQKHFTHFPLILRGATFPFPAFSWGRGLGTYGTVLEEEDLGLLVPDHLCDDLLSRLQGVGYRILYKEFANNDWSSLSAILFDEDTPAVRRILRGFQAAGGRIVSKEGAFGLEGEESLDSYLQSFFQRSSWPSAPSKPSFF
ncbi:MAG: hypothetical protein AAGI90_02265 [Chlamydiota bacterium]